MTVREIVVHLTAERGRLGLSLRDAAAAQLDGLTASAGLSPATLHRYERGLTEPHMYALEAWAGALGYDLVLELRPRKGRG